MRRLMVAKVVSPRPSSRDEAVIALSRTAGPDDACWDARYGAFYLPLSASPSGMGVKLHRPYHCFIAADQIVAAWCH